MPPLCIQLVAWHNVRRFIVCILVQFTYVPPISQVPLARSKAAEGDRKPETDTMSNRPLNLTITSSHLDICTTNFIVNIHFYFIHSYSYYIPTANASSPTKHLKTQLCYRAETRQLTLPQKCNEILVDTLERRNSRALILIQCMTDDRSVR